MSSWILWYILITILGWISLPAVFRLLPNLKDRGFGVIRTFGWLIWGFSTWILASLGVAPFISGGLLIGGSLLLGLSVWGLQGTSIQELIYWLRSQKRMVITSEVLFFLAFAGLSIVRAANPEALGTEKPMELAFINAILRSPTFPPHDPWLSGYGISYYYFGYVLTAMLAKFTGTSGSISFNLGVSLVFGLSACGAYGIVYNLLNSQREGNNSGKSIPRFTFASLLAPLFVLIVSNFEGFLDMLHSRGLFWKLNADGTLQSGFWRWLDIQDLNSAPSQPLTWIPDRFWWWWRASRVLQDYDLRGASKEIIDEFPFFSYLLADLHPHVLAMPFAFLAITLAMNTLLFKESRRCRTIKVGNFDLEMDIEPIFFVVSAISIGGLAFLNTWDFPVYVFIFAASYGLAGYYRNYDGLWQLTIRFIGMGIALGIAGILFYLPFYLGFSSQAGGFLPNLIYPTRGVHLWVMFGPLLFPIFIYLLNVQAVRRNWSGLLKGLGIALLIMLTAWLFTVLLGWGITLIPERGQQYLASIGADNLQQVIRASIERRTTAFGGWLTLLLLLGLILSLGKRIFQGSLVESNTPDAEIADFSSPNPNNIPRPDIFQIILILTGLILVISPEFLYLLDMFGWRMNTIFKFYFQAWLIWSVAAAYGSIYLLINLSGIKRIFFLAVFIMVLFASLVYPVLGLWNKTNGFSPGEWTLDSSKYYLKSSPEEMAAIDWLSKAESGAVAEAVPATGGSYTEYGRVSTFSGQPAVLGWVGHENQWRGGNAEMGSRLLDLERLFCSKDWEESRKILDQYEIRYVFVGNLERATYLPNNTTCPVGLVDGKFKHNLNPVFQMGQTAIYEYSSAEK